MIWQESSKNATLLKTQASYSIYLSHRLQMDDTSCILFKIIANKCVIQTLIFTCFKISLNSNK